MKMNRRNALLGIGAIATGGGALFGSGAFSQVDADRTVNITTTGDGSANLQLEVDPNSSHANLTDSSGTSDGTNSQDTIQIDATNINDDAQTTYNGALRITNNGTSNPDVNVSISTSGTSGLAFTLNKNTLTADESTLVDLTVDTTTTVSGGTVTITATSV